MMPPINARQIIKSYLLSIGIWSALSLLTGWEYLIFDQLANIHSTLLQMMQLAEGRGLSFALLTPPIFYIVLRNSSSGRNRSRHWLFYCVGVGPYMIIYSCVRWVISPPWNPQLNRFEARSTSNPLAMAYSGFADIITIYAATVLAAHAYGYFERIRKQDIERLGYQQALAEHELQALRAQLHPHFLFNTLHGIATLIDSDGKVAKQMIVKLSSLLRVALEQCGSSLVPLCEELKFIEEYLDLEKMRFGDRLTVKWSIDLDTEQLLVPQLILQPLVENAIRHGVGGSRENGWVEIMAQAKSENFEVTVRNSVGAGKTCGTGLGLRNTELRLKHLYCNEATFAFTVDEDRTAVATLILPALGSKTQAPDQHHLPHLEDYEVTSNGHIDR